MFGEYSAGKAEKQAFDVQAQQVEFQGQQKIEQLGEEETTYGGAQTAAYARAGVAQSGSALDVKLHTATNFEYDKLMAKYSTESAASAARYKGRMAMLGAEFQMRNTLTDWGLNTILKGGKVGDAQKVPTYDYKSQAGPESTYG